MSPTDALRHLQDLRRRRNAYGLRLQRDGQGHPFLLFWGDDGFQHVRSSFQTDDAAPGPLADALAVGDACPDGTAAIDHAGALHLETFDAAGPQAAHPLGPIGCLDVRLPNRGPGFGGICPLPADGSALLLSPGPGVPPISGHRILDAAALATAAGFPPPIPTPVPGLCIGLLVMRRLGRIVLRPLDDGAFRISSWPLHPSVPRLEEDR
jgi:hypothetical protein